MREAPPALRPAFVAYLERLTATHARGTITGIASRLAHFGRSLAAVDSGPAALADLDRRRHIEPYLTAIAAGPNSRTGAPISTSERRGRVLAIHCLLNDIGEWGWPEAPTRRLIFRADIPSCPGRCPATCPPSPTVAWPQRWRPRPTASPPTRCCSTRHRDADRRAGRPRAGLRPRDPRPRRLAESPAGQARHRADGPPRRRDPRHRRPHRRAPLTRAGRCRTPAPAPVEFLLTHHGRRISVHSPARRTHAGRPRRRPPPRHPPSAAPHLRHRPGQRRRPLQA